MVWGRHGCAHVGPQCVVHSIRGFLRALLWGMVGSEGGMVGCEGSMVGYEVVWWAVRSMGKWMPCCVVPVCWEGLSVHGIAQSIAGPGAAVSTILAILTSWPPI